MLPTLMKTIAVLSLVGAVVIVAWCMRSFQVRDTLTLSTGSHTIAIDSSRGLVRIWVTDRPVPGQSTQASHLGWETVTPIPLGDDIIMGRFRSDSWAFRLGFGFNSFSLLGFTAAPPIHMWQLLFPQWFAALLLLLPPALRVVIMRRRRRTNPDACLTCGYDLRASGDQCPECGTVRNVNVD